MDKRLRTNLLLVVAVLAIGAFIWLAPDPKQDTGVEVFPRNAEFTRIEVREEGELHFALARQHERWQMFAPYAVDADRFQVDSLLAGLRQRAERAYPVEDADLAELGLHDPRWSISVDGETLHFGNRTALGNNRYARKGDTIYLLSDVLNYRLQRDPMDYADKRLLPQDVEIAAIELPAGQRIERDGFAWQLMPANDAVSSDAIQQLADAWRHASALSVRAVDALPAGETVVIEIAGGDTLRFAIEVTEAGLILTREQPLLSYELPRDEARRLLQLEVASRLERDAGTP